MSAYCATDIGMCLCNDPFFQEVPGTDEGNLTQCILGEVPVLENNAYSYAEKRGRG